MNHSASGSAIGHMNRTEGALRKRKQKAQRSHGSKLQALLLAVPALLFRALKFTLVSVFVFGKVGKYHTDVNCIRKLVRASHCSRSLQRFHQMMMRRARR